MSNIAETTAVLPQILNYSLGFDVGTAQCLIAPPYAFAGIMVSIVTLQQPLRLS
jgi:hypothetical protein